MITSSHRFISSCKFGRFLPDFSVLDEECEWLLDIIDPL